MDNSKIILTVAEAMPEDKYDSGNHCREMSFKRTIISHTREYELLNTSAFSGEKYVKKKR
jgi:hypothetical protein